MTTKKLLLNASKQSLLTTDATFKLNNSKKPLIVIGTVDYQRHFHMIGVAIVDTENELSYICTFEALKSGIKKYAFVDFCPKITLSDSAEFIKSTVKKSFGKDVKLRVCSVHMIRNIKIKVNEKLENKELQEYVIKDVLTLIDCPPQYDFKKISSLFLMKYENEEQTVKYLRHQWINKNAIWHKSGIVKTPSTTNAIEAINNQIKIDQNRNIVALGTFIEITERLVKNWSKRYINRNYIIHSLPKFDMDCWRMAYKWHTDIDFKYKTHNSKTDKSIFGYFGGNLEDFN